VTAFIVGGCTVLTIPAFAYVSAASKSASVAGGSTAKLSATCANGHHVTLGGLSAPVSVPLFSGPIVFPQQFFADTTQTKWTVVTTNGDPSHSGTLTSRVYCGPHTARTVVTKTVSIPSGGVGVATAMCPTGTVVLGGGYKTPAAPQFPVGLITRMRAPTSDRVEVALVHVPTGAPTTVTAIAYCGNGPALTEVSAQTTTDGNASTAASVTATCPPNHHSLMWGGMWGQYPTSTGQPEVLPFSMTASSKSSWTVQGYNQSSAPGFLRALAYCR
jgi:hypothetical protein